VSQSVAPSRLAGERLKMKIFLAGATGAIGKRLVPLLVADGHEVTATTRSPIKLPLIATLGGQGVVMNGLDPIRPECGRRRATRSDHPSDDGPGVDDESQEVR